MHLHNKKILLENEMKSRVDFRISIKFELKLNLITLIDICSALRTIVDNFLFFDDVVI